MNYRLVLKMFLTGLGATINYLWGGFDMALNALLLFMVLDYILGVLCGKKNKRLSSKIAFLGLFKKMAILIIITVGFWIDKILNANGTIRNVVIFFYIGLEGISIIENAAVLNVPIPKKLKDTLLQLKEEKIKL